MDWSTFTGNLAAERHPSRGRDTGDDMAPPDTALTLEAVNQMRDAGWTPPDLRRGGNPNWRHTLTWPAMSSYHAMAHASALALQLRGISAPTDLTYQAWRDPEPLQPAITYYDGDLDPGNTDLTLPSLGIDHLSDTT